MSMTVQTAQLLTVTEMRKNARVDDSSEDDALMLCAAAAEEMVLNYCHTSWEELLDIYGAIPAAIKSAMLVIATGMYNLPEGTDGRQQYVAPFGVLAGLTGYIRLSDREV